MLKELTSRGILFIYLLKGKAWGVTNHWTGLLDWNTGLDYWTGLLDYWTDIFLVFTHSEVGFIDSC